LSGLGNKLEGKILNIFTPWGQRGRALSLQSWIGKCDWRAPTV